MCSSSDQHSLKINKYEFLKKKTQNCNENFQINMFVLEIITKHIINHPHDSILNIIKINNNKKNIQIENWFEHFLYVIKLSVY